MTLLIIFLFASCESAQYTSIEIINKTDYDLKIKIHKSSITAALPGFDQSNNIKEYSIKTNEKLLLPEKYVTLNIPQTPDFFIGKIEIINSNNDEIIKILEINYDNYMMYFELLYLKRIGILKKRTDGKYLFEIINELLE
jgi:hypothetical protein